MIALDLAWTVMATIYDWETFSQIPAYLWPFLIICPIFPLIIALVWAQSLKKRPSDFLLALGAMSSVTYLFAAIVYYPTWMLLNGFDWMTFGAIFWVAAYGAQGVYLLLRYRIGKVAASIVGLFLLVSVFVQYWTQTSGAQDFTNFSSTIYRTEYFILGLFIVILSIAVSLKKGAADRAQR